MADNKTGGGGPGRGVTWRLVAALSALAGVFLLVGGILTGGPDAVGGIVFGGVLLLASAVIIWRRRHEQ